MHEIVPSELQNDTILEWHGSRAKVVGYNIERKMLGIILYKMGDAELLLVVATGCQHIVGAFSWKSAELSISRPGVEEDPEEESTCYLVDCSAGFHLKAATVALYRIPTDEFCVSDSLPHLVRRMESAQLV